MISHYLPYKSQTNNFHLTCIHFVNINTINQQQQHHRWESVHIFDSDVFDRSTWDVNCNTIVIVKYIHLILIICVCIFCRFCLKFCFCFVRLLFLVVFFSSPFCIQQHTASTSVCTCICFLYHTVLGAECNENELNWKKTFCART